MASQATLRSTIPATPRQNWVLGPIRDLAFIIATPILTFILVATIYPVFGLITVWMYFMIYTVAHHLPGFIRIYGDRDLLRRFKFRFLLGPLIPAGFATGIYIYSITSDLPALDISYIMLVPIVWDVWHFLMQHYGFMRIYDGPNTAPRALASRMDLAVCWVWFIHIMIRAGSWLPDLLEGFYEKCAIPLLYLVDFQIYQSLISVSWIAALGMTACYGGYVIWCWMKGYFVSPAKLLLLVITFGTMYFTYIPNNVIDPLMNWWHGALGYSTEQSGDWDQSNSMRWNFWLGFVVMGLVHNTQYFAIVWKYNRSLAKREGSKPPTPFLVLFAKGGALMLLIYVVLSMAYGSMAYVNNYISGPNWLVQSGLGFVYVLGFTSVMMHYYFDGFIWKVRHKENQENLSMLNKATGTEEDTQYSSWWTRYRAGRIHAALATALQLTVYFGAPLALLTVLAMNRQANPELFKYHMRNVVTYYNAGMLEKAIHEAERATELTSNRLTVLRHIAELDPTAEHYYQLGEGLYRHANARKTYADLREAGTLKERQREYNDGILEAIALLERASDSPGPINLDPTVKAPNIPAEIAKWKSELAP